VVFAGAFFAGALVFAAVVAGAVSATAFSVAAFVAVVVSSVAEVCAALLAIGAPFSPGSVIVTDTARGPILFSDITKTHVKPWR
jgi:hypothetical protein